MSEAWQIAYLTLYVTAVSTVVSVLATVLTPFVVEWWKKRRLTPLLPYETPMNLTREIAAIPAPLARRRYVLDTLVGGRVKWTSVVYSVSKGRVVVSNAFGSPEGMVTLRFPFWRRGEVATIREGQTIR